MKGRPDAVSGPDTLADAHHDQQPPEASPSQPTTLDLPVKPKGRPAKGRKQSPTDANLGSVVSTVLALTSGLLSYALVKSNRQHKKRYHRIQSDLEAKQSILQQARSDLEAKDVDLHKTREEVERLQVEAAAAEEERSRRLKLEAELRTLHENLRAKAQELTAAQAAHSERLCEVQAVRDQLKQQVGAATVEAEQERKAAEDKYAAAEVARTEAEARWQQALDELMSSKAALEEMKGELGLTRSQMEGLLRELDFTKRELADAQQRLSQAQFESRQRHSGYGTDDYSWD